jgi:hypothetical protein
MECEKCYRYVRNIFHSNQHPSFDKNQNYKLTARENICNITVTFLTSHFEESELKLATPKCPILQNPMHILKHWNVKEVTDISQLFFSSMGTKIT